jgi:hypothetical protein
MEKRGSSLFRARSTAMQGLSRFLRKIRAERSEVWRFSAKPRSGPTLTGPERHSGIFAQRKGDFRFREVPPIPV